MFGDASRDTSSRSGNGNDSSLGKGSAGWRSGARLALLDGGVLLPGTHDRGAARMSPWPTAARSRSGLPTTAENSGSGDTSPRRRVARGARGEGAGRSPAPPVAGDRRSAAVPQKATATAA